MFRVLHGLSNKVMVGGSEVIKPDYISESSKLFASLNGKSDMMSLGIDLSLTPVKAIQDNPGKGVVYALLVIALMGLYFVQQRMIASRTVSPTMSASQQKIMQYLPVAFGVFQFFFPVGLVVYYISQTLVRIAQQQYITRRFYRGEHSLGQQAQAASAKARHCWRPPRSARCKGGSGSGRGAGRHCKPGHCQGVSAGRRRATRGPAGASGAGQSHRAVFRLGRARPAHRQGRKRLE
jgi:hypothetical protein